MCGIAGVVSFSEKGKSLLAKINDSVITLSQRGPDANGIFFHNKIALGHTRLKIIDTSENANQPMTDSSGRFTLVFNGEIYNFRKHRKIFEAKGIKFKSQSDTEVLLQLYIHEKEKMLEKLEGDFAFAIYDNVLETLFIARDRFGVKPLLYYSDDDKFIFASEMKAILAFGIPKTLDETSIFTYLQLNYIPAPNTVFKNVKKLEAGNFLKLEIRNRKSEIKKYYAISVSSSDIGHQTSDYNSAQKKLIALLNDSVQRRLISDVPLGTFLSGGIDSSIITALAANHTKNLNTFSIGFKDEPFFDETNYAQLVAKKYRTNHTVFSLSNNDLYENLHSALNYIDEPFADSSSIAVNILSKCTKQKVTVALSGDGADEIFSGYNKHTAEFIARNPKIRENIVKFLNPLWKNLPKSRNTKFGNLARQLHRFSEGMNLSEKERYWRWASFMNEENAKKLLNTNYMNIHAEYEKRKNEILKFISPLQRGGVGGGAFNSVLLTDINLVLQNDMLFKVDLMSMAHGLEVRVPFLDFNVVNFVFSLPAEYKINRMQRKKILRDAFKNYLPQELYNRPKHGFEVPLLKWFKTEMKSTIENNLLNENFILEQNIFNAEEIKKLKEKLFSKNPEDAATNVWNLLVFQHWWKKYFI